MSGEWKLWRPVFNYRQLMYLLFVLRVREEEGCLTESPESSRGNPYRDFTSSNQVMTGCSTRSQPEETREEADDKTEQFVNILLNELKSDEEDKGLQEELLQLVEILTINSEVYLKQSQDEKSILGALGQLRVLIRTSTTSMTSVPKPLKYLREHYDTLKEAYSRVSRKEIKSRFADILSVLAIAGTNTGVRDCLRFCLDGTMRDPGDWGHEYVRQLETEIVEEWSNTPMKFEQEMRKQLLPLVKSIVRFDMKHNAEIQACDLCQEIDELDLIGEQLDSNNFLKICQYLMNCAYYSEEMEQRQILETVAEQFLRFNEYCQATLVALQLKDSNLIHKCLTECPDPLIRKQLAYLLARQQDQPLKKEYNGEDEEDIVAILSNAHVSDHFRMLARELDILEPKLPEDIYKTWAETGVYRRPEHDSARVNLAASFVTGFVHAGFGQDKLMANTEECWVYKNKDHGMMSATASLGLIHLWDVDGGLDPIDKYLYTNEDFIKSGALLAIGLVNCGVRNECDPALALLSDHVLSKSLTLRVGALLGLGLAYAGSRRKDVNELLTAALTDEQSSMEVMSVAAIALGLVNVGSEDSEVSSTILQKLLELTPQELMVTQSRFLPLALGMVYMGCRDSIETPSAALEVLPEPYKLASQTMLQVCSYAGTGDVLIVQELLRICSEPYEGDSRSNLMETISMTGCCNLRPQISTSSSVPQLPDKSKSKTSTKDEDIGLSQAIASLGVGVVGFGEGKENSRIFGQIGRYGSTPARRAMPLSLALSSLSDPDPAILDVLNKYSHDSDVNVADNAILALGLVGAGSNNARLATMLRQLAAYHAKNPAHLFLIRISQGLVHLGKGTISLRPLHYASKVPDQAGLAGILVVLVSCLDCRGLILGKSHYLLYCLTLAMEPRWLVTLDENLNAIPVSVRVGQPVDTTGKAGCPKTIAGGQVHSTPVLLTSGERAELVGDQHEALSSVLEGFVILKEKV
ncbi:26S proteasome non-ATPase regulatory subunit 2 [Orussus abietinus]|uniref:26S proteasome non-ATPase regulatory subunit 2 n=1 Tax=Orussus abietinus TaxID=222816 RepID=UPI0006262CFD|nr:26S proteasome non-ATPase regulatory subunit 2 [Orussus abietinus]